MASTSRSDGLGTEAEMTRVSRALVLLTLDPTSWSHSTEWAWRSFGRRRSTDLRVVYGARRLEAVAVAAGLSSPWCS